MEEAEAVGEPSGDATAVLGAESAVTVRLAAALLVGRAVVLMSCRSFLPKMFFSWKRLQMLERSRTQRAGFESNGQEQVIQSVEAVLAC